MRWGIPDYRLPKSILKIEIKRILQLSIDVKTGARVGKEISFEELDRFDAVFLSPGAGLSLNLGIEGEDLKKVWRGGDLLDRINSGDKLNPAPGERKTASNRFNSSKEISFPTLTPVLTSMES